MNPIIVFFCFVAGLAVLTPHGVAAAQDDEVELVLPAARQGYFIGGGLAFAANINDSDEVGQIGPLFGSYFNLRLGEMVTDWFGFGLHFGGGPTSDDRYDVGFGGGLLDVQFVLFDHFALRGGVGAGGLSTTDNEEDQDMLLGTGGAYYLAGASYDYFPFYDSGDSGGFSVTPTLQFIHLPGNTFRSYIVLLGVETLWWTGLDSNKLILPEDEAYSQED